MTMQLAALTDTCRKMQDRIAHMLELVPGTPDATEDSDALEDDVSSWRAEVNVVVQVLRHSEATVRELSETIEVGRLHGGADEGTWRSLLASAKVSLREINECFRRLVELLGIASEEPGASMSDSTELFMGALLDLGNLQERMVDQIEDAMRSADWGDFEGSVASAREDSAAPFLEDLPFEFAFMNYLQTEESAPPSPSLDDAAPRQASPQLESAPGRRPRQESASLAPSEADKFKSLKSCKKTPRGIADLSGIGIPQHVESTPRRELPLVSDVRFSAIAPKGLVPATYATVDVVMYEAGWEGIVAEAAAEQDGPVGTTSTGWLEVARQTMVKVQLTSPELGFIGDQMGMWTGRSLRFTFPLAVPASLHASQVLLVASVSFNGVAATRLSMIARVGSQVAQAMEPVRRDVRSAFISYSSSDRARVAAIVQGMQTIRPDLDVFFDVESLRTGQHWKQALMDEISARDVLYLCWSQSAKLSPWVDFEWRYALDQKGLDYIEPVSIDPPELCEPPAELSDLHFNNRLLYIINAS